MILEFPCEFSLKVFAAADVNLEEIVVPIVTKNDVDIERIKVSERGSSGGKYISVTVTFIADSQKQLDAIYTEVSANPQILMAL